MPVDNPSANVEQSSAIRERHLLNIADAEFHTHARKRGRKLTGGPNACGATASQYYLNLAAITKAYTWAQDLVDKLLAANICRRVSLAELAVGDLVVCVDLNGNGATDHVWHVYGLLPGTGAALALDNRANLPYKRNLGKGRYTAAKYALRLTS